MEVNTTIFHKGEHLEEIDLLSPDVRCPLCGSERRTKVFGLQSAPVITLLRCADCLCCSASRLPTEAALRAYYAKYYRRSSAEIAHERVTFDEVQRFAKHLMSVALGGCELLGKQIHILDFGGGDGSVAVECARLAVERGASRVAVIIVDYNTVLCNPSSPSITVTHCTSLDSIPKDILFDLVIASAVLEHLPFPMNALMRLLSVVKFDGGRFYARTPFMEAVAKICTSIGIPIDFTYPAHIHDMGQGFWERFLDHQQGYRLISSRPSIVETSLRWHPFRTLVAYMLKAPWWVLGSRWRFVGGWEIVVERVAIY